MHLPFTAAALPQVQWLDSSPSTNSALRELVTRQALEAGADEVPEGTLIATANQTAGRGRLGRGWETPPGTALAASMLIRPDAAFATGGLGMSWLPLLAGSAITRALQPLFQDEDREPMRVGVKWPNDVHVRGEEDAMAGRPGAKL